MIEAAIALLLGALTWTLLEYLLHRFVFHGRSASRLGAREHRQHHANPDYFAPWWQKALAAVAVTALLLPLAAGVAGLRSGVVFTLAFVGTYLLYEVLHRRAHTRPPRGPYGRWRRRNHFAHHFHDPRRAHGVTTPAWDHVFGTRLPADRIRVPRRLAMRWLVDDHGALREGFAADYELVGARARDERTRRADTEAALANRPPEIRDTPGTAGGARAEASRVTAPLPL
jgi:sterol desaturase/sphingolipid hydroxylase (fatty acid hydroxylase superfamily)